MKCVYCFNTQTQSIIVVELSYKQIEKKINVNIFAYFNKPVIKYIILRLGAVFLTIVNVLALLLFLTAIHKLVSDGTNDLKGALGIAVVVFGLVPFWSLSVYVLRISDNTRQPDAALLRIIFVFSNVLFILLTVILNFSLPYISEKNYQSGRSAHNNNQISRAITLYEKALYQQSGRSDVHFALANLYESITKYELSKEHYWLAIRNDQTPFEAYNNLARLYIKEKLYDDALDLLAIAKEDVNNDNVLIKSVKEREGIIFKNIAWSYMALGEYETAIKYIKYSFDAIHEAGVIERHPSIQCIIAISSKHLGKEDDANIAQKSCSERASEYKGIERALARSAEKL